MTEPISAVGATDKDPESMAEGGDQSAELTDEQVARRQRVIDAAFELAAADGYDAVHMREVAATANVALATIYRNFSSKDQLLAAAMGGWIERLQDRVAQRPPRGSNPTEQMIDVFERASSAMSRQPKLTVALIRAMASPDAGVRQSSGRVRSSMTSLGDPILAHLDEDLRIDILNVLGHVWYSSLVMWANGRADFEVVTGDLRRACEVLITPYNP